MQQVNFSADLEMVAGMKVEGMEGKVELGRWRRRRAMGGDKNKGYEWGELGVK